MTIFIFYQKKEEDYFYSYEKKNIMLKSIQADVKNQNNLSNYLMVKTTKNFLIYTEIQDRTPFESV
jgi:hypothetical protein